jgi:hypothetical protein
MLNFLLFKDLKKKKKVYLNEPLQLPGNKKK